MVYEVLSRMIKKTKMGYITGFKVGMGEIIVSNLQFADDTMIFCDAEATQLGYLRCILSCFEVVLGLKINLAKSELFQVGEDCDIDSLVYILGCKIGCLPASYLGLPLGANYKSKVIWEPAIDKISLRIDSWKAPLLSKGGRLTLIKASLAATPNYFLSLFTVPKFAANRMDVMFINFLWHDIPDHHKYHLVD